MQVLECEILKDVIKDMTEKIGSVEIIYWNNKKTLTRTLRSTEFGDPNPFLQWLQSIGWEILVCKYDCFERTKYWQNGSKENLTILAVFFFLSFTKWNIENR